jgi:DNA-directed RNA polymerase specialized sigma24 family protein
MPDELAALYRLALYRFARGQGLQEADSQDLAQNVLAAVADRIAKWRPDKNQARFRT